MKKITVLKTTYDDYKKKTIIRLAACIAFVVAVLALNIALYSLVTEETATLFTVINTVLDTLCFWVTFYYTLNVLLVRKRLLGLYEASKYGSSYINGRIVGLSAPQKVYKFDCLTAELETSEGARKVFVIVGSFEDFLKDGATARFLVCNNVAISAEVENEE